MERHRQQHERPDVCVIAQQCSSIKFNSIFTLLKLLRS